jgi:uncharacterized damage-inducible protein DinB
MTKAELLQALTAARAEWEAMLAQVGQERMTVPAINDGWSIKDTIGHVTYYEHWVLDWLEAVARGQVVVATHRDLLRVDERNVIIFRENRDRPLHSILEESRQVHERLVLMVRLLPESDLLDPHRFERYVLPFWETGRPLWRCIADNSYEHYDEHRQSIQVWLDCLSALDASNDNPSRYDDSTSGLYPPKFAPCNQFA